MTQTVEVVEALPPAQVRPTGLALFNLNVTVTPLVITWDKQAVMAMLGSVLAQYEGLVVQEENVPAIRSEMAGLNKLAERFDTARKDIKRQVGAPLAVFDEDVKDVTARIIEVRSRLDAQVREFERIDREGRRQSVQFVIDSLKNGEKVPELDIPIKPSWLNKSTKAAQLHAEIQNIIIGYKRDKAAAEQLERAKSDRISMVESVVKAKAEEYGFSLPMGKFSPCLSLDITGEEAASVIAQTFAAEASLRERQARDKGAREAAAEEARQAVPTPAPAASFIEEDDFPTAPPVSTTLILSVTYEPARELAVQELLAQLRSVAAVSII